MSFGEWAETAGIVFHDSGASHFVSMTGLGFGGGCVTSIEFEVLTMPAICSRSVSNWYISGSFEEELESVTDKGWDWDWGWEAEREVGEPMLVWSTVEPFLLSNLSLSIFSAFFLTVPSRLDDQHNEELDGPYWKKRMRDDEECCLH